MSRELRLVRMREKSMLRNAAGRWVRGIAIGAGLALGGAASAAVNLEWEAVPGDCAGKTLWVELYAVSTDIAETPLAALSAVLTWDPEVLTLIGLDVGDPAPHAWLYSGFPPDSGLDGLNTTWADGAALYTALAQPGAPAMADADGLLVARFAFTKRLVGVPTWLALEPELGSFSETVVYGVDAPGWAVTGTLEVASLHPAANGDVDCNRTVSFSDINPFVLALTNPAAYEAAYPGCPHANADLNCDGRVDFEDINPFVARLSS